MNSSLDSNSWPILAQITIGQLGFGPFGLGQFRMNSSLDSNSLLRLQLDSWNSDTFGFGQFWTRTVLGLPHEWSRSRLNTMKVLLWREKEFFLFSPSIRQQQQQQQQQQEEQQQCGGKKESASSWLTLECLRSFLNQFHSFSSTVFSLPDYCQFCASVMTVYCQLDVSLMFLNAILLQFSAFLHQFNVSFILV